MIWLATNRQLVLPTCLSNLWRCVVSISGPKEFIVSPNAVKTPGRTLRPAVPKFDGKVTPRPFSFRTQGEIGKMGVSSTEYTQRPAFGGAKGGNAKKPLTRPSDNSTEYEDSFSTTLSTAPPKGKTAQLAQALQPTAASGLIVRLLKMRVVKNMTKNGKYARFSALVAVGNGKGGIGVAHSKSLNASDAIAKASQRAIRVMEYFPRWQDRTIFHDDAVKFKASRLIVRPAAPDTGKRCHPAIAEICRCMGIKDISSQVHGSRHPMNVAQAFLLALRRQKTPEMVAQEAGLRIVDVLKVYQQGCEELTRTLRSERYSNLHLKI